MSTPSVNKDNKEKGASKPAETSKELQTDMPLSEKDEVKKAESNTGKAAEKTPDR